VDWEESGFALLNGGLKAQWVPDEAAVSQCVEFAKSIAAAK
jgi:hypothetical protein